MTEIKTENVKEKSNKKKIEKKKKKGHNNIKRINFIPLQVHSSPCHLMFPSNQSWH